MTFRIFVSIILGAAISLTVYPLPFVSDLGVAYAEGRGGDVGTTKAPPKTGAKPPTAQVSVYNDFPQSKYREIRDFQIKLATSARKQKLKDIATNERPLRNFILTYERFKTKYKGLNALELNKVFTQLKKYARQTEDKELAIYAKGMLHAFAVYDELQHAKAKYKAWKDAPDSARKSMAKIEYEEAQDDYYKSRSKLPFQMIMSFPVIPDIR